MAIGQHSYQLSAPLKNQINAPHPDAKINYELSLQNRFRVSQRPQKYQSAKEVQQQLPLRIRRHENVRQRRNRLHQSQLRLARQSPQNKTTPHPPLRLGPRPRYVKPVARRRNPADFRRNQEFEVANCDLKTTTRRLRHTGRYFPPLVVLSWIRRIIRRRPYVGRDRDYSSSGRQIR